MEDPFMKLRPTKVWVLVSFLLTSSTFSLNAYAGFFDYFKKVQGAATYRPQPIPKPEAITQQTNFRPGEISPVVKWQELTAGFDHTCGIKTDGSLWCWGNNEYGQLGIGSKTNSNVPVKVMGLNKVKAVSAGGEHTCALTHDGAVWCWGDNRYGQLGNYSNSYLPAELTAEVPMQVDGLSEVKAIRAYATHTCVIKDDDFLWCWGNNKNGELGNASVTNSNTPVRVEGLSRVTAMGTGESYIEDTSFAVRDDGLLFGWGSGGLFHTHLGLDAKKNQAEDPGISSSSVPIQIPGLAGVKAVGNNWVAAYAMKNDGTVWRWGEFWEETGGIFYTAYFPPEISHAKYIPEQIPNFNGAVALAVGAYHACVIADSTDPGKRVWCWGINAQGQLGDGQMPEIKNGRVDESMSGPVWVLGMTNATSLAAGADHTCAIKDGEAWCWGENKYGQLGAGISDEKPDYENHPHPFPVQVK